MRREPFISLPNTRQQESKNENSNFPAITKAKRQLNTSLLPQNKASENKLI